MLDAIKRGTSLKKVTAGDDAADQKGAKGRRATIAAPSKGGGGDGMDLMAALKSRMDQRRRGISGARKTDNEGGGGGTADVQPSKWNLIKQDPSESPISMAGIASALKAAASNRKEDSGADEDWSDEN